jgi:hypothetical protein
VWVQPKGYKVVGAVLAASRDANLGNAEVERASRGHYNISRRFFLRKEGRMFLRKEKSTERLPWYRAHKGALTESEKRQLDSFRMRKDHPAASYDNLPKEVRMYMSKLELQLYDKTQEGLSVVRDFETGGGVNQERVWRIMVDVTRLVCGEATDGFGWSCV